MYTHTYKIAIALKPQFWRWSPQGFVLIITIIREAVEEIRCYVRDKEVNSQIYSKLSTRGKDWGPSAMVKEICETAHSEHKLKTEMCCFSYHSWQGAMAFSRLLNRLEPHKIDSKLDSWIVWSWCVDCIRVCSVLQQKCTDYHSFSMGSLVQLFLLQTCLELKVEPSSTFWLLPSAAAVSHAFQQSDTITKQSTTQLGTMQWVLLRYTTSLTAQLLHKPACFDWSVRFGVNTA